MKRIILTLLSITSATLLFAQEGNNVKEYLTGSFDSNSIYYLDDTKTNALAPDDHIGSNNYLKLDYYKGDFSAGVQLEAYSPVLLGYPTNLNDAKLTNLYATWNDEDFSVTAGSLYDQFGSGLLFRAWEDRMLGMNNALMGARVTYNYNNIISLKGIWGTPRFGMEYTDTRVRGLDGSLSLSNLLGWSSASLAIEGSLLDRYEEIDGDMEEIGAKPNSLGYSGRLAFEHNGFSFKGEILESGEKHIQNPFYGRNDDRVWLRKYGNAQLMELGYSGQGLGVNLALRRLEWMNSPIITGNNSTSNLLNYVPAMCAQNTYMLTNMHPYTPQLGLASAMISGEIGGQLDIFYNFKRGSQLGGKRGMKIHANFATYYSLYEERSLKADNMLLKSVNIDLEKQITRKFKMYLLYCFQEWNPSYGENKSTWLSNTVVADLTYKFTNKFSTRLELQYLTTFEDHRDWMAFLLELNLAPHWSVYGSDMYNHGDTKVHYYNVGVSYTKSRTRVSFNYGRNRAGYVCSGGVCRAIPAYTGGNLMVTISF